MIKFTMGVTSEGTEGRLVWRKEDPILGCSTFDPSVNLQTKQTVSITLLDSLVRLSSIVHNRRIIQMYEIE